MTLSALFMILYHYNQYSIMFNNYTPDPDSYQTCHVIVPSTSSEGSLLIGDFNSATDPSIIKLYNIATIITAATGMQHLQINPNITHITYPLIDSKLEDARKFFDECSETIKQSLKRGSVLVHCAAGISRSSTLVLAYLMKTRKIGFKQAIALVRSKRKNVCPNLGFERQLKKYEHELFENNNRILKKAVSQKISKDITTSLQIEQHSFDIKDRFILEPKTADGSVRKRIDFSRRRLIGNSQVKERGQKKFKVRPIKDRDGVMIYGQKRKGLVLNIDKIISPLVINFPENTIHSHWGKMPKLKNRF